MTFTEAKDALEFFDCIKPYGIWYSRSIKFIRLRSTKPIEELKVLQMISPFPFKLVSTKRYNYIYIDYD